MENQTKMIKLFFALITLFCIASCSTENHSIEENQNTNKAGSEVAINDTETYLSGHSSDSMLDAYSVVLRKSKSGELTLELPWKKIQITKVISPPNTKEFPLASIIDQSSFTLFTPSYDAYTNSNQKEAPYYYLRSDNNIYHYRDKNHTYAWSEKNNVLRVIDSSNNCQDLRFGYLRCQQSIYFEGNQLTEADADTFNTDDLLKQKSEWNFGMAMDKNHLYIRGSTISYKDLQQLKKHYLLPDGKIEQWQNKYFPNKK